MTHATIKPAGPGQVTVAFAYSEKLVKLVKVLPGADYDEGSRTWTLPVLSLPALKAIFATLTVAPAVISEYHQTLRQMLEDFAAGGLTVRLEGSQVRSKCLRKGELGKHLGEVINTHRAGIVAVLKQGPIVAPKRVERPSPQPATEPDTGPVTDKALEVFLKGAKNAQKKADKTAAIVKAKRRKKKETVAA